MLPEPTGAQLNAPILRLQIAAATALSVIAAVAIWTSVHHLAPDARRLQHAAVPTGLFHGTMQPTSGRGPSTPGHHHL
jgi:hypothetical protein